MSNIDTASAPVTCWLCLRDKKWQGRKLVESDSETKETVAEIYIHYTNFRSTEIVFQKTEISKFSLETRNILRKLQCSLHSQNILL